MKQIIFFGDSLTAGYGLKSVDTESFPARLQQKIFATGYNYQVINAGLSGDTTSSGLARLNKHLLGPADIFVIALGANDMLRGYSPVTMATNILEIIARVKKRYPKIKLLLLGMELPAWITAANAAQYRQLYSSIASRENVALLPFLLEGVAGQRSLNFPDGVHPNARGYEIIAEKVWPALQKLL